MGFGTIDREYAAHLATVDPGADGPIWMVNFMRYRDVADYGDGSKPAISGREADDRYAPTEVLAAIGAEVAYFGDVVDGPPGSPAADRWHRMAIVRYPTRRSFIDMQARKDFQERRVHKDAGMEFTIIMGCLPLAPAAGPDGAHELDGADGPDGADGRALVRFSASPTGSGRTGDVPAGVPFAVEGTVVGDDRRWERLELTWHAGTAPDPPGPVAGGMEVWSAPLIDRVRPLVARAPEG